MRNLSVSRAKSQTFIDPNDTKVMDESQFDIKSPRTRWVILFLSCLAGFGNQFCVFLPSTLQHAIMQSLTITVLQFNFFHLIFSFSNIVIPFLGGFIINKIGVRTAYMLFSTLIVLGLAIGTYGAFRLSFPIMLVGQAIYSIGTESLVAAQCTLIAKWFLGKQLSFSLGLMFAMGRLGMVVCVLLLPNAFEWEKELWMPYALGALLCIGSWFAALVLVSVDFKNSPRSEEMGMVDTSLRTIWNDVKNSTKITYLLMLNCLLLFPGFFGFLMNAFDLIIDRYGFSFRQGGNMLVIVHFCTLIFTPLFGYFADKKGKRTQLIIIAAILLLCSHLAIAWIPDSTGPPVYAVAAPLAGIGLFYAIYTAAFWPCLSLVVEERMLSIIYGLTLSMQSLAMSIVPLIIGVINVKTSGYHHGYFWTEIMLACVTALGVIVSFVLYMEDRRLGRRLSRPMRARESVVSRKSAVTISNSSM